MNGVTLFELGALPADDRELAWDGHDVYAAGERRAAHERLFVSYDSSLVIAEIGAEKPK